MKPSYDMASEAQRARVRRPLPAGPYRFVRRRWHVVCALGDAVGRALLGVVRAIVALVRWLARRPRATSANTVRRILLVQLDHLGDCVITTAMLEPLARRYPGAEIDVLAGAWTCELFAACPEVSRVFISRRNRFARPRPIFWWASIAAWAWRLRRQRYDLAIDVRGEAPIALLLWLSGARRRLGWAAGGGGFFLTDSATYLAGRPEQRSRAALLAALGIAMDDAPRARPAFVPDRDARRAIAGRLARDARGLRPLVVLHLGAGTEAKRWPLAHWQELLGRLIVAHDPRIVLVGTESERALAEDVLAGGRWPGVENWLGQISVRELIALLERADLFVGGDSGPAHMAAALGRPTVVLMSGTNHLWQWRPQGKHVVIVRQAVGCSPCHRDECVWRDHPCMAGMTPAAVAARVDHLLERARDRQRQSSSFSAQLRTAGRASRYF